MSRTLGASALSVVLLGSILLVSQRFEGSSGPSELSSSASQPLSILESLEDKSFVFNKEPKSLEDKNSDVLKLLSSEFHKGPHGKAQHPSAHSGRGRDEKAKAIKNLHERAQHPAPHGPPQGPGAGGAPTGPPQGGPPGGNAALEGLIAAWSGASWWEPCNEVCMPRKGTKRDKANFNKFKSCTNLCRKDKTKELQNVMAHIKQKFENQEHPHKPMAPHEIQKLSKFLVHWAEGNGLPVALGDKANKDLKDNEQVGQSISGMMISSWSSAGWWKPCGEVCAPSPGEKRTKANFHKFMECEQQCRGAKGSFLRSFLDPNAKPAHKA